ncbi:MAG: Co2+/Mg2+ efflux protein ApaG [Saprospiraceae bacterium]|nr:Co2+/Mg2+ efflux protein ApaG [Saprospiraceae bacterium]
MDTLITKDIRISVETFYKPEYSNPIEGKYIFAYRVLIENIGSETVQLLRRHWIISDSTGVIREVEGEGVIGQKPVLNPGESHQYISWSNLSSELGTMHGTYLMKKLVNHAEFKVDIPRFSLLAPYKLN